MRRAHIDDRLSEHSVPEPNTGCWLWLGAVDRSGYGRMRLTGFGRRMMTGAHRMAWISRNGDVPAGMVIDHKCRVRACVNPDHLRPLTPRANTLAGDSPVARNARATHCKRGHAFTPDGVVVGGGRRYRLCLACHGPKRAALTKAGVL